jgi:hypothetical protein
VLRARSGIALVLALGACNVNAGGIGSGSGAMPDGGELDGDADTGTTNTTGDETSTAGSATLPPADDTATGPSMDDGPSGRPMVTISDGPTHDFGPRDLATTTEHVLTVTNGGDGDATAVQVVEVGGAFDIVGHDCGDVLAPGATCEVQLAFAPTLFGDFATELQIAFQDQGRATSAARPITGRGIGVTGNLLVNGGGELGNALDSPPMGWVLGYGPSWSANWPLAVPYEGNRTISAGWGPPDINNFTLDQPVSLAAITSWGDGAGLRVHYRAFHRSEAEGNDPTWIELRFLDSGGNEMGLHAGSLYSGTAWNESMGTLEAPPSAHSLRLSLQCDRLVTDWCGGFFDGVEVWAEWSG